MRDVCFWTGPVSANQVAKVKWSAPTDVVTVGHGVCGQKAGDTNCVSWQAFTALAASLPSGNGKTKLDALLPQSKTDCSKKVSSGETVLLIGDSLAVGLNPKLKALATASGCSFKAFAETSTTMSRWLHDSEVQAYMTASKPSLVLVCLGTNDSKASFTDAQLAKYIADMRDWVTSMGARLVWILPPHLPFPDRVSQLVIAAGIDTFYSAGLSLGQSDGIHPSGNGYMLWAGAIWSELTCTSQSAPDLGVSRRVVSGFSAGGAFLEGLCADKPTAAQLDAVMSLDSWYFSGSPPGLMAYVDRAVNEKALMIITTSGAEDYGFATPAVQVKPMLEKIGVEDMDPKIVDALFGPAPMPRPVVAQNKGRLFHFGWGKTLFHTDHAKLVGPYLLEQVVSPYLVALDEQNPPGPGPGPSPAPPGERGTSWLWWVLGGGAAIAGGWYGGRYAMKRWFSEKAKR